MVVHVFDGLSVFHGHSDICNLLRKFLSTSKVSVMYEKFGGDVMAR